MPFRAPARPDYAGPDLPGPGRPIYAGPRPKWTGRRYFILHLFVAITCLLGAALRVATHQPIFAILNLAFAVIFAHQAHQAYHRRP